MEKIDWGDIYLKPNFRTTIVRRRWANAKLSVLSFQLSWTIFYTWSDVIEPYPTVTSSSGFHSDLSKIVPTVTSLNLIHRWRHQVDSTKLIRQWRHRTYQTVTCTNFTLKWAPWLFLSDFIEVYPTPSIIHKVTESNHIRDIIELQTVKLIFEIWKAYLCF